MNAYRETILAQNNASLRFISWLFYAYGSKGRGILDPVGWALARVKDQPELFAEGACYRLAVAPPEKIAALLRRHIESGMAPSDADWALAFHDAQLSRLRELEDVLGLRPKPASKEALSVLDNPYRQR